MTFPMRQVILRAAAVCWLALAAAAGSNAQSGSQTPAPAPPKAEAGGGPAGGLSGIEEVRQQLREQREEIERLRAAVREQSRLVERLLERVERAEQAQQQQGGQARAAALVADASDTAGPPPPRGEGGGQSSQQLEERIARAEEAAKKANDAVSKQLGSITFGGDIRFRYESLYGQQNALASAENPAALGNPLTTRQRLRVRARFSARGKISDEFAWGLRLSTGSFADVGSTNQTLTDFFNRKSFALDQAYITYKPKAARGFQLQAGKFDTPWLRTELTWDNDISPEGLSESYTREFKDSTVKSLTLVAWQLPMLERNSAFVLGPDGKVDFSASGRAGRDLALYGGQARTELAPSKNFTLRLSAADLYFSGTQFITPAQVFGGNIQFPISVVIPASGSTPARTVTTQVSVPRDLLVSGNANLGLSLANTNATNRDGRLSSGFNLVDLIARADFTRSRRWPVMLLFNFVTNTQAHDVVTAGPGGGDLLLENDEGQGFWAELQAGKDLLRLPADKISRGDLMFNYTLARIEKDAILSPFNGSDLGQSTDARIHRFIVGYAAGPRVQVTLTGFFTRRANGLLGPFAATPPGSLDRTLTRLQLDTVFRF